MWRHYKRLSMVLGTIYSCWYYYLGWTSRWNKSKRYSAVLLSPSFHFFFIDSLLRIQSKREASDKHFTKPNWNIQNFWRCSVYHNMLVVDLDYSSSHEHQTPFTVSVALLSRSLYQSAFLLPTWSALDVFHCVLSSTFQHIIETVEVKCMAQSKSYAILIPPYNAEYHVLKF